MTKRKPGPDWGKVYGDTVRSGRQYIHVAAADMPSFQEWARGRLSGGAWKRVLRSYRTWPHKGVQIHVMTEITE